MLSVGLQRGVAGSEGPVLRILVLATARWLAQRIASSQVQSYITGSSLAVIREGSGRSACRLRHPSYGGGRGYRNRQRYPDPDHRGQPLPDPFPGVGVAGPDLVQQPEHDPTHGRPAHMPTCCPRYAPPTRAVR